MKGFFWSFGHIGWGIFAVAIFTVLWLLVSDWIWRTKTVSFVRFVVIFLMGWVAGVGLIILVSCVNGS